VFILVFFLYLYIT